MDPIFYVRIARDAGATASPQAKLVLMLQEASKGRTDSLALTARGKDKTTPLGPYPTQTDGDDKTRFTVTLDAGTPSATLIEAIRNADSLDYKLDKLAGTLDLKGLSATLRWIDAQQGRAGTPTALVAKGMTPIGQVPGPRAAPVVTPAPAGSVQVIAKPVLSKAALAKATAKADCEPSTQSEQGPTAWRLDAKTLLVSVPCSPGAYNFPDALFFADADGKTFRPVVLPQGPDDADGGAANVVVNSDFDPKTMVLSEFNKGRGISDCGDARSWLWTGKSFVLLEASSLGACVGIMPDDWPSTYVATRAGK